MPSTKCGLTHHYKSNIQTQEIRWTSLCP
uniref:Uncharacterized protein n=1 Tax=Anguilla anguilla TaxID=7936 RepID=A0A0E9P7C2_ANGAN